MFQIVRACLKFSPYTHFYTQVLIDIIVKTYNTKVFRSDLLFKSQIGVFIEETKYSPNDFFSELEEYEYTTQILLMKWVQEIDKISNKKHNGYMKFFETIRDLLIENFIEKKTDLKERLELISKYSNNSLVRNLSVPEKLFLYETKRVFDIHYVNIKPAHALFLYTKFKTKYICDEELSVRERTLDVEEIVKLMKSKNLKTEQVYELENTEEQIRKVQNSPILIEYNREYKRMHGLHYNHQKEFTEKKFKEWSKKARELRDKFSDNQLEQFKIELKKLSDMYWK